MSAFKSHKRKSSIKNESDSPASKHAKVNTIFPTPEKTPKQQQQNKKTPKSINQQTESAGVKSLNKKTPNQAGGKPKLEVFKGTGKLNFTPSNTASGGKNIKMTPNTEPNDEKVNRQKRRRILSKEKREERRNRFNEVKNKVIHGDEVARKEIQEKLAALESGGGVVSKTRRRKIAILKRILNKDGESKIIVAGQNKQKQVQSVKPVNKTVLKKQQNGKPVLAKPPVKLDEAEDNDDDEEESSEELGDDQEDSSEEEGEEASAEEDDEEASAEDEEASAEEDDDSEEESEGDEDEESDNEPEEISNKKPVQAQINKQVQKQNKQPNKPGRQEAPSTPPAGFPNKSRYVVFVGNIAFASTESDLRDHFKNVGEIADIRIPNSKEGKPRGFAYVELQNDAAYQKALSLHNSTLGGRKINVLYAEGGKKKSENRKNEIKAKNFNLQAKRRQGQQQGNAKGNQKRPAWHGKKPQ